MHTKRTFIIEGTYKVSDYEPQEYSYQLNFHSTHEQESQSVLLYKCLSQPWRLLGNAKRLGVKSTTRFFLLLFLFGIVNVFFIIETSLEAWSGSSLKSTELILAFLSILFGVCMVGLVLYWSYRNLVKEVYHLLYALNPQFFRSLSDCLVEHASHILQTHSNIDSADWLDSMDLSENLKSRSAELPNYLRQVAVYIASKVLVMDAVSMLPSDLKSMEIQLVKANFYQRTHDAITEDVFGKDHFNWVIVLLPVNLIIQMIVLYFISL